MAKLKKKNAPALNSRPWRSKEGLGLKYTFLTSALHNCTQSYNLNRNLHGCTVKPPALEDFYCKPNLLQRSVLTAAYSCLEINTFQRWLLTKKNH